MDNINQVIRKLEKIGFTLIKSSGSKAKLYPPNKQQKFYSIHLSGGGKCFFPLSRFAREEWNIDLNNL